MEARYIQMELLQELKFWRCGNVCIVRQWHVWQPTFASFRQAPPTHECQMTYMRFCVHICTLKYLLAPWCAFATKGLKTDRIGVCYQTLGFKTTWLLYKITCFSTTLLLLTSRADGLRTSFMTCFYFLQSVAMAQVSLMVNRQFLISFAMWFLHVVFDADFCNFC